MAHFIFFFLQLVYCTLAQLHHTTCSLFLFDIVHRLVHITIRVLDKNMRYESGSKIIVMQIMLDSKEIVTKKTLNKNT